MVDPKCYRAIKGCDDVIAEDPRFHTKKADGTIKKLSPEAIANLRSLYDEYLEQDKKPNFLAEYEDKDIPNEVVSKLADTLYAFRTKLQQTRGSRLYNKLSSSTNFSLSFINIARALSPAVVQESSEFIAQLFRKKANVIAQLHNQRFGTDITYLDVMKGVKSKKGKMLYGKNYLLDLIYNDIAEAYINNNDKSQSKIDSQDLWNVLLSWGPLVTLALTIIGNQERLNIGLFKDFAYDKANGILSVEIEDSFQDTEADVHDVEESTKESWQEDKHKKPLLSRVLDVVKRELATIVDERAQNRVTTLPVYKRIALDEVHTFLAQQLCGVPNETEMIKQLKRLNNQYNAEKQAEEAARNQAKEKGEIYVSYGMSMPAVVGHHLMETFNKDVSFKTALFVSYSTAFTAFSKFRQYADSTTKGINAFFRKIINRDAYKPKNDIRAFLKSKDFPQEIFKRDKDGALVFSDNAKTLINNVIKDFSVQIIESNSNNEGEGFFGNVKGYAYSEIMKKLRSADPMIRQNALAYLAQAIRNLGINITTNDLVKANAASIINGHFLESLVKLYDQLKDIEDEGVIGDNYFKIADADSGYGRDLELFAKLVYEIIGRTKYESRALVLDKNGNKSSVSSMQAPCYFTDFFGTLKYYYDQMKQATDSQTAEEYKQLGLDFIKSRYAGTFILNSNGTTANPILSALLESFYGNSTFLENFSHDRYAEMDIKGRESRAEKLSDIDIALTLFHSYFGPHIQNKTEGMFPLFILGDSNVHRYMSAPLYTKEEAVNMLIKLVKAEFEFEKNLEAVNKDLKKKNFEEIQGTIKGSENSWIKEIKTLRDKYLAEKQEDDALKEAIIQTMSKVSNDFLNKWEEKNLNSSGKYGFRFFGVNSKKQANITTRDEMVQALDLFVHNYAVNTISQLQLMTISTSYYSNLEELQKRYKEVHASGSKLNIEASNPYAQPNKEGKYPPIFIDKDGHFYPYERVIYFDDILINIEKTDPDFAKVVEKVVGRNSQNYAKYLNSTLTDGQSYRSIDSYRKMAIAQRQWNKKLEAWYQKLQEFKKVMKGKEFTTEQLKELDSYDVIIQPQKPYLFTHERYSFEDVAGNSKVLPISVQHKCAEVILIPELLPAGSNLRHLAEAMSENNIDVACSTTVVKVGMFGATNISYKTNDKNLFVDKEGNIIPAKDGKTEGITRKDQMKNPNFHNLAISLHGKDGTEIKKALMKGYVHELDLSTYYRQQNVPAHTNDPRALGTQMRKIVFTAIKNDGDYSLYFPGLTDSKTKRTNLKLFSGMQSIDVGATSGRGGANLCKFYNGLIVQNIIESFENLVEKLADNTELAPILQQMSLNNSRNTVYDLLNYALAIEKGENEEERLRDFLVPLCDPTTSKDTISTLISLFRNEVNKQIMCGGSAVQASAFGIEEVIHDDAAKSNHKDIHTPDDGNLRYVCEYETDKEGNYVLDKNDERIPINVLYAECEMPFDLYYTDESGKKVNLEYDDYVNLDGTLKMTTDKNDKEVSLLEKEFPGILDVVAYRIPTERAYSAINLKIKRFSRKVNGGTIKVPSAGSVIAGFDFKQYWSH